MTTLFLIETKTLHQTPSSWKEIKRWDLTTGLYEEACARYAEILTNPFVSDVRLLQWESSGSYSATELHGNYAYRNCEDKPVTLLQGQLRPWKTKTTFGAGTSPFQNRNELLVFGEWYAIPARVFSNVDYEFSKYPVPAF